MYNRGLVLEGGGTRGVYTAGVLDCFLDNGIEFDYVIGVSAGSCNGASFLGKCKGRMKNITINYVNDKRYMGISHIFKEGEFLNGDWIYGELTYDICPLDQDAFEASGAKFKAVVANSKTGDAEYIDIDNLRPRGCPEIRASCSMPLATKGVKLGNKHYFDGGLVDSIPVQKALDDGCEKTVVILTQHKGYTKSPINKNVAKLLNKKYPQMAKAMLVRHEMYNNQLALIDKLEAEGKIFVIRPSESLNCPTLEKEKAKLEKIYALGQTNGAKYMEQLKEYLK